MSNSWGYPWWWAGRGPKHVGKRRVNKEILQKKVASVGNPYHNRQMELHWFRALTVPMHLGLMEGSFVCCIIWYQLRRALSLYQSSGWPPDLRSWCPVGPRKGPGYIIPFSQKVPASESPPGSPTRPLWRERCPLTGHFYVPQTQMHADKQLSTTWTKW